MRTISITKGKQVIVDDEDYDNLLMYKWYYKDSGRDNYAMTSVNGKTILMHRYILNATKEYMVDHINGDGLDNRRCNLRLATNAQNQMNKSKNTGNYTSKYKGVSYCKNRKSIKKYQCRVYSGGKYLFHGYFLTEIEAALAYNKYAIKYFGEFAYLNSVEP